MTSFRPATLGATMLLIGLTSYLITDRLQAGAATQEAVLRWGRLSGVAALVTVLGVLLVVIGLIRGAVKR